MSRFTPLWRSDEICVYRFDHPVETEDQAYEANADCFRASFVEEGKFNLEVGDQGWRVAAGDVMLGHPGMRFRASFDGEGFNDTCLSVIYLSADDERFDSSRRWARNTRTVVRLPERVSASRRFGTHSFRRSFVTRSLANGHPEEWGKAPDRPHEHPTALKIPTSCGFPCRTRRG